MNHPARATGQYQILFCLENGLVTGDGAHFTFDNRGDILKSYRLGNDEFQFADSRSALPKLPAIPAGLKFATPFRDDFDGPLDPVWQWIDPKGDSSKSLEVRKGFLRFAVRGYHDLWPGNGNYTAPRLMRQADGDFTLETKLAGPARWCGGLLVWKDEANFVRLDRGIHFQNEIGLEAVVDGKYTIVAHDYVAADPAWFACSERAPHTSLLTAWMA